MPTGSSASHWPFPTSNTIKYRIQHALWHFPVPAGIHRARGFATCHPTPHRAYHRGTSCIRIPSIKECLGYDANRHIATRLCRE